MGTAWNCGRREASESKILDGFTRIPFGMGDWYIGGGPSYSRLTVKYSLWKFGPYSHPSYCGLLGILLESCFDSLRRIFADNKMASHLWSFFSHKMSAQLKCTWLYCFGGVLWTIPFAMSKSILLNIRLLFIAMSVSFLCSLVKCTLNCGKSLYGSAFVTA